MFLQGFQRLTEFINRGAREANEADVADGVVGHEVGVDGIDGDLVARDFEVVDGALAEDVDGDDGAFLAAQVLENEVIVDTVARGGTAVDADELVAHHDADFLGGASIDDGAHNYRIVNDLEGDADAFEVALEPLVGPLDVLGGDVHAVRVEGLEHGLDGFLAHAVHVGGIDVVAVDEGHDLVDTELSGAGGVGDDGLLGAKGIEN